MSAQIMRLPTAAKRRVRQGYGRDYANVRDTLPQFPMEARLRPSPYMEECMREARLMLGADRTAAMLIALAIYRVLDREQREKVVGGLVERNSAGSRSALAWVNYEDAPKSRKTDIDLAAALVIPEFDR